MARVAGSVLILGLCCLSPASVWGKGMLFPRDSESRQIRNLDGMWNFRIDTSSNRNQGFEQKWFSSPLQQSGPVVTMPVPSSYNDVLADKTIRDFVGWAWYDREFFVPSDWMNKRVVLRFESAHYYSIVYVNSQQVMTHNGGHLPFEVEINQYVNANGPNRVTLALNNTLTPDTLPPGTVRYETDTNRYPAGYFVQNVQMDFFNYGGIHRHVRIYSTPKTYIDDITITTDIQDTTGIVRYEVTAGGQPGFVAGEVAILDKMGNVVGSKQSLNGTIEIPNANFWWPYTMNTSSPGYQYTLKVTLGQSTTNDKDVYRLPFGIRTVNMTTNQWLINNQPFYCHGVNKHEDADIRGKGLDYALIARDFSMLKWLGANCFRTSHYPYAEEILDQASEQGIVIIDESPGVGITELDNFDNASLSHHMEVMGEMVRRDKNKPAVLVWSVANEPRSGLSAAGPYFKSVIGHTRSLDPTRPVTFVCNNDYEDDFAIPYVDIILINRYYAWYSDNGHTEVIQLQLDWDLTNWRKKYNKPIMVSEYGADTIAGLHREPSFVFSEEYQVDFMSEYHQIFDKHRNNFFVGELVWNFADFMTVQGITRVNGNRKGLLSRQREPKASAHLLRKRYMAMFNSTAADQTFKPCSGV
ncbi:beta-glucuronidase [Patella vulgata]|uniref:beta-glucuronidase n=1 Tax=Patella vulgata TaxID=6465 RepID=UPI00217FC78C|nr:beta-glucuronidase [Patella vulgata]